ncbi:gamma-glutamyltransferase [Thermoflavimicrobium dichotomicum]|uniref:Glutathione hydrolase proenzyme n=1 Tax=Thermoflavimicrobium dichotomicum TaxID=46223 RepID=A0A1I3JM54_9BACL|nr:gamma-glutamyltransferase [Thermoflavimicrobium dichotomicum]SFI61244.1 gamma-glutamyltranspeptidase / glutathione hydrolase [Thermoflavimicrobium dichotomicum]
MPHKRLNIILSIIIVIGMIGVYIYKQQSEPGGYFNKLLAKEQKYAVSTAHPEASRVGMQILEQGGTAVDAAIAISYALGVVEPFGSGIGGGGTMLVYPKGKDPVVFDYRETAPFTGTIPTTNVGVPGFVKGMEMAHKKFGKLPMDKLIQPSIDLAEKGVAASDELHNRLKFAQYRIDWRSIPHLYPGGKPIEPRKLVVQKDLANTLKQIRDKGSQAFYSGPLAEKIALQSKGLQVSDLQKYQPEEKKPLIKKYRDYEMISTAPPSGGVMLYQSLVMADQIKAQSEKDLSAEFIHLLAEVNKRVTASKRENIGDPKFTKVPTEDITSASYIKKLATDIQRDKISTGYKEVVDTIADKENHDNTTHFVVIDKEGNVVSTTNTLSNFFGSGIYVDGFFLNNQLANFSESKNSPNKPAPGKKPISYTAPTILAKDNKPIIAIGSAGGRNITPVLTEILIRIIDFNQPLQKAIDGTRFIVEKNNVILEENIPDTEKAKLIRMGYQVEVRKNNPSFYGSVQGIKIDWDKNTIDGGADLRRHGDFKVSES